MWVITIADYEVFGPLHQERDAIRISQHTTQYGIDNVYYFSDITTAMDFQMVQTRKLYQDSLDIYREVIKI